MGRRKESVGVETELIFYMIILKIPTTATPHKKASDLLSEKQIHNGIYEHFL